MGGRAACGVPAVPTVAWPPFSKCHDCARYGGREEIFRHAARVRPADLRPLRRFAADYPEARVRLACLGGERPRIDGVECLPAGELPRALAPGAPLP